ncbi:DUF3592 domain-containing protein [Aquimarina sp. 2201CG14-23]|uniref:DUF3592 domain-containing protein n=1 Tax=Aquimarina mycalae TaxID=3040073 RepID=UPI002477DE90|nr:DUF3592 domain-containing protein [Aquimarina sp. 2201CG14-23]MDH7447573.1 DUF3592 domain-containing protein [Aquimarina sp. 2201CG14-23]
MRFLLLFVLLLLTVNCFSQGETWVKTEGEITEINKHRGRYMRETAIVKFHLENGTEQLGNVELSIIPYVGSTKSVGDTIIINYDRNNPVILKTTLGKLLSSYGMYCLIFLGIIFSIKPFLKQRKN